MFCIDVKDFLYFIQAMVKEVDGHESCNHWSLIKRSSLPPRTKTIMYILLFKCKRFPDGQIMKHKARVCAHGGMKRWGIDYWETYSHVVNWIAVCLLFALTMIHDLESRFINFFLAFPEAELKEDVYMELSFCFDQDGDHSYVMKLKNQFMV